MSHIIEISSFDAPELDIYARTSENQLVNRANPAEAMFIAESPRVIERALDAGYEPVSCLVEKRQLAGEARTVLERLGNIPVYTCLLYTSDAADEEDSGDLGGRRFIKKKKN